MSGKIENLKRYIGGTGKAAVAFSGGVDSSLMLKLCSEVLGKENVVAITGVSETYTDFELGSAAKFAEKLGVKHVVIRTKELANPDFSSNPPLRCYHCKKEFFTKAEKAAKDFGARCILDGSNNDDLKDYRPGRKAAQEAGVESPLAKFAFSKDEIRALAKKHGIKAWNRPSSPCLASRVPYGETITGEKLKMIYEAEKFLKDKGFKELRVRHHGKLARIEVPPGEIAALLKEPLRTQIIRKMKALGFTWTSADLSGYRTGSLNEALNLPKK